MTLNFERLQPSSKLSVIDILQKRRQVGDVKSLSPGLWKAGRMLFEESPQEGGGLVAFQTGSGTEMTFRMSPSAQRGNWTHFILSIFERVWATRSYRNVERYVWSHWGIRRARSRKYLPPRIVLRWSNRSQWTPFIFLSRSVPAGFQSYHLLFSTSPINYLLSCSGVMIFKRKYESSWKVFPEFSGYLPQFSA